MRPVLFYEPAAMANPRRAGRWSILPPNARPPVLSPLRFLACAPLLAAAALAARAETEPAHPMIDFAALEAPAEALDGLPTPELESRRGALAAALATLEPAGTVAELERGMLDALLRYDAERVRIVELIPVMIKRYGVDAELGEDLMNFRATLRGVIDELRPEVVSLQTYKPYDFRVGISYMSLMATLQQHPEVRARMRADQTDPATPVGAHQQRLSRRYAGVERVRAELERSHRRVRLQDRLARVEAELRRRQAS